MISLDIKTANEINNGIANRVQLIRKRRKISRNDLAKKSGVSYASIRRFEETGEISLISLSKGMADDERVYGALAVGYADTEDGMPIRTPLNRTGNEVTYIR